MILKKIKRTLAFTLLLAMLLSILPPVALAADTPSYEKATSIAIGDTVLLVYKDGSMEFSAISTTSTKYGIGVAYTDSPAGVQPFEVVEGAEAGTFAFKFDDKYLFWTSGNSLNATTTFDAKSSWTVTFDADGNATIANVATPERTIRWNAQSPRFACYTNGQQNVQLYKLASGSEEPTEPTCEHENTSTNTVDATCTTPGSTTVTCNDCGETIETIEIPATDHSYTDGVCDKCGEAKPAAPTEGYVKMVSGDTLSVGDTIVIVCETKGVEMKDFSNTSYAPGEAYTDIPAGVYPLTVSAGATEDTLALKGTDGYLGWKTGNSLITADSVSANSSWTITIDDNNNAIILNSTDSSRKLQWNASSPRFACYTSNQTAVQIYKYVSFDTGCQHENKTTTEEKAATCTEAGYTAWSCPDCGENGSTVIPSTGHTEAKIPGTDATCTADGLTDYIYCSVCNEVLQEKTLIPSSGHSFGEWEVYQEATCINYGELRRTCSACSEIEYDYSTLVPDESKHAPGESRTDVLLDATCTYAGEGEIITFCKYCDGEYSREPVEYPMLPHNYEDGFCTGCGAEDPQKDFTLTTTLNEGDQLVIYYPADGTALANVPSGTKIAASTVTVNGTVLTSAEDTAVFTVSYVDDVNFTLQLADGTYLTSPATGNGLSYTEEVTEYSYWYLAPIDGTDLFNIMSTNAAYSGKKDQALEYYKGFTVYGLKDTDIYKFQLFTIPGETACAHEWDEGVVTTDPTCYSEGEVIYTCGLCSNTKTEILPALEHNYGDVIVTMPGCIDGGYTTYTCTNADCEHSYVDDQIPALGHDWVDATCLTGTYCSRCRIPGGCYVPISSASQLNGDDQIVIVANVDGIYKALSTDIASKIDPVDVAIIDGLLVSENEIPVWTVENTDGGFALRANEKYLAYGSSTNFKSSTEVYSWSFTGSGNGIVIASTATNRGILYRSGTYNVFGAYSTDNIGAKDYYGELLIFKYIDGSTLPHEDTDNNNLCDNCDSFIEPAALLSRSITLNGNIGVNFYMSLSEEVTSDPGAYMLFTQEGKEPVKVSITDTVARTLKGKQAYCFTYEVAAKEMTDEIKAQLFYGDTCTEEYTYSVKTYADNQRVSLSDNQALMNLLDAMLRYGAASQLQFNYHTKRLANEGLEPVDYTDVQIEGFPIVLPQGTDLVSFAGASLLLESETTLRFFLRADASVENFTVTYEGQPLEIKIRNGLYYVDVEDISAPDLDMSFTITVNDGTNTADISYSPLTYCSSIRTNYNSEEYQTLLDVCAALYLYNQAANAYFTPAE